MSSIWGFWSLSFFFSSSCNSLCSLLSLEANCYSNFSMRRLTLRFRVASCFSFFSVAFSAFFYVLIAELIVEIFLFLLTAYPIFLTTLFGMPSLIAMSSHASSPRSFCSVYFWRSMSASLCSSVRSHVSLDLGFRAVVHLSRHYISERVSLPPVESAVKTWLFISLQVLPNIWTPTVSFTSSSNVNLPCLIVGIMHCLYLYRMSRLVLLGKYSEISLHFN